MKTYLHIYCITPFLAMVSISAVWIVSPTNRMQKFCQLVKCLRKYGMNNTREGRKGCTKVQYDLVCEGLIWCQGSVRRKEMA